MGLKERIKTASSTSALQMADGALATLFANRFRGYGSAAPMSPEDIEAAAQANRNIILDEVVHLPPLTVTAVRMAFGRLAPTYRQSVLPIWNQESQEWEEHDAYQRILEHVNLADPEFDAHISAILRHTAWFRRCLDQAIEWFIGTPPE